MGRPGRLKKKAGPLAKQAEHLDENRVILYKKGRQLGNGYYIVEISTGKNILFIAAYDVETPESFLIELPPPKSSEIEKEFQSNWELMANSLQVMNKRLVLLNPNYVLKQ